MTAALLSFLFKSLHHIRQTCALNKHIIALQTSPTSQSTNSFIHLKTRSSGWSPFFIRKSWKRGFFFIPFIPLKRAQFQSKLNCRWLSDTDVFFFWFLQFSSMNKIMFDQTEDELKEQVADLTPPAGCMLWLRVRVGDFALVTLRCECERLSDVRKESCLKCFWGCG